MTHSELIDEIVFRTGISKDRVKATLSAFVGAAIQSFKRGNGVNLPTIGRMGVVKKPSVVIVNNLPNASGNAVRHRGRRTVGLKGAKKEI